jgi:hypothetical protein
MMISSFSNMFRNQQALSLSQRPVSLQILEAIMEKRGSES